MQQLYLCTNIIQNVKTLMFSKVKAALLPKSNALYLMSDNHKVESLDEKKTG